MRRALKPGELLMLENTRFDGLNIPTGVPLVYQLDAKLRPIKSYYLGDPEEIRKAQESVAMQGKARR